LRVKLAAKGAGRWEQSGGVRSKFGLFISEVMEALEYLRRAGMGDCLNLLHFHLGSQINNIRNIKHAIIELVRVYVEMQRLGAGLQMIDVGGGLGVDYDGSKTDFGSSINYGLQEYANDVVFTSKKSATRPASSIRRSSASRAGPWWRITACWCLTCWVERLRAV